MSLLANNIRFMAVCLLLLSPGNRALPAESAAAIRIGTLHPLLTEMVQRIGGDRVQVEQIMGAEQDPHTFDPKPQDLARLQGVQVVVVMGKGLETYLDRLKTNLPASVPVIEAGRKVPSILITTDNPLFICCPEHSKGSLDPHWWHDPSGMRRAVRSVASELGDLFPAFDSEFAERAKAMMEELEELDDWVKEQFADLPRSQRKLVTSHASFAYFCKAYGFQMLPLQGLTTEHNPTPAYLTETIETIKKENIRAVFPEKDANTRLLETIQKETGVRVGEPLLSDNTGKTSVTYRQMIQQNVENIRAALTPGEK